MASNVVHIAPPPLEDEVEPPTLLSLPPLPRSEMELIAHVVSLMLWATGIHQGGGRGYVWKRRNTKKTQWGQTQSTEKKNCSTHWVKKILIKKTRQETDEKPVVQMHCWTKSTSLHLRWSQLMKKRLLRCDFLHCQAVKWYSSSTWCW